MVSVLSQSRKINLSRENSILDALPTSSRPPQHKSQFLHLALQPMTADTYLNSPLETILESIYDSDFYSLSVHDLIEAYNVFSVRIRAHARELLNDDEAIAPVLALVKERSSAIAFALSRDVRRALTRPSQDSSDRPFLTFGESLGTDVPWTSYDVQFARDLSKLCHYALCCVAAIFAFRSLLVLFTDDDLRDMLDGILNVVSPSSLPTSNSRKTWALSIWILQVQNLPIRILQPRCQEIATAIRRAVQGDKGPQARIDALKAMYNILKQHSSVFLAHLIDLFPDVLAELTSESEDCRLHACYALNGFVIAKLENLSQKDFPHRHLANAVHRFIKDESARSKGKVAEEAEQSLPRLVPTAYANAASESGPSWALSIIASFIVLSDSSLFFHPPSLKFTISNLAYASVHKQRIIRSCFPSVWKTLVWVFSRISAERNKDDERSAEDTRDRALLVIRQELRDGIALSLVHTLLKSSKDHVDSYNDVAKALMIVRDVVSGQSKSRPLEGLLMLSRLLSAIGVAEDHDRGAEGADLNVPERFLFDGAIFNEDSPKKCTELNIQHIRALSEAEVDQHWDQIMSIWIEASEWFLRDAGLEFSSSLIDSWQALLLVQTHLTQEYSSLTSSPSFGAQIASTAARFIALPLPSPPIQARNLLFVQNLWKAIKNVFSASWLPPPAEIILAAILEQGFALDNDDVRIVWSQLCADLIAVGIPTVLHVLVTRSRMKEGTEVTRHLWTVLARVWLNEGEEDFQWEALISFLVIPFGTWVMDDPELELWEGNLKQAVLFAVKSGAGTTAVIQRVVQKIGENQSQTLAAAPKAFVKLLSYIDLTDCLQLPADIFSVTDAVLSLCYPPVPETHAVVLESLRILGQIFQTASPPLLVEMLIKLEKGLACWLEDGREALLDSEHNVLMNNLYCRALTILRNLKPSLDTLRLLVPFFVSGFMRLPYPAIGPLAFENFWRATYHGIEEYKPHYPDRLKACLLGYSDSFGGSLGKGLSPSIKTQETPMSTVPDSQPPYQPKDGFTFAPEADPTHVLSPDRAAMNVQITEPRGHTRESLERPNLNHDAERSTTLALPHARNVGGLSYLAEYSSQMDAEATPLGKIPSHGQSSVLSKRTVQDEHFSSRKRRKTESTVDVAPPVNRLHANRPRTRSAGDALQLSHVDEMLNNWDSNFGSSRSTHRSASRSSSPLQEEYSSWEAGISIDDLRELQGEISGLDTAPQSAAEFDDTSIIGTRRSTDDHEGFSSSLGAITSPRPSPSRPTRSRTLPPEVVAASHISGPTVDHTIPVRRTASRRLEALQRAYTAFISDENGSQIQVEDLVHATALVNKIGSALTEQIQKKLV